MICGKEYQDYDPCTECVEKDSESFRMLVNRYVFEVFESTREDLLNEAFAADLFGDRVKSNSKYKDLRIIQLIIPYINIISQNYAMYLMQDSLDDKSATWQDPDEYLTSAPTCLTTWMACKGFVVDLSDINELLFILIGSYTDQADAPDCYL